MSRYHWIRLLVFTGLIVILAAGCSKKESQSIDPPQIDYLTDVGRIVETMGHVESETEQKAKVSLYYKDLHGYVVPLSMEVPYEEGIAKLALKHMTKGGPNENKLPHGFSALIPEGTEVIGLNILPDRKLAIVDFSKNFNLYPASDERKLLEAITWTLTSFDTIDQVQIWVDGRILKQMPNGGIPLDEPLSRAMGINIEQMDSVHLRNTSPVTLYFQNQTIDHHFYFVPVTRMVARTNHPAKAVMEQLIKGPSVSTNLLPVLISNAEVLNIEQMEDQIILHMDLKFLDANHKAPHESVESIILSLTDTTNALKVQIMVDDHSEVYSTENVNFSLPVVRPMYINQFEM